MSKKSSTSTEFTRATFVDFLTGYLNDLYRNAGEKIESELDNLRKGSTQSGFLEYLKGQEQELLKAADRLPPMTNKALSFQYAAQIETPETDWKAEYLKATSGKGLDWFNDYVAKIWREIRQSKTHSLIFRLSMDKAEFQRLLGAQLRFKMKTAERHLRKEIEARRGRVDAPSFFEWLKDEREKLLNTPDLLMNDHGPFYSSDDPEANAESFVSTIYFDSHPIPVDWWEVWESAMPFLANFKERQNQDWKWKGRLLFLINAVNAEVKVKIFTEYIEGVIKPKRALKKAEDAETLPAFESVLLYPDRLPALWVFLDRKQRAANREFFDSSGKYIGSDEHNASPLYGLAEGLRLSRQIHPNYNVRQLYKILCHRYHVSPTRELHKAKKTANFTDVRDWVRSFFNDL